MVFQDVSALPKEKAAYNDFISAPLTADDFTGEQSIGRRLLLNFKSKLRRGAEQVET